MNQESPEQFDDILATLTREFIDDTRERLHRLQSDIVGFKAQPPSEEQLTSLYREVHSLKGLGGSFGFPTLSLIAHRLEDYMERRGALDDQELGQILSFFDAMEKSIGRGVNPSPDESAKLLRGLPVRAAFDGSTLIAPRDVHVLLLASSRTLSHLVSQEMAALGFKVSSVPSAVDAFSQAVVAKPDLIISSATTGGLAGTDLCRALHAMLATRDIPFIILTSFERNHPMLRDLPSGAAIVRTGDNFANDIAEALEKFELI